MPEAPDTTLEQFKFAIANPGMKGLNTLNDPTMIDDMEMADCRNVFFNDGLLTPRTGTALFAAKPTGETGNPLQLMTGSTSDKVDYMVSVYDSGNFYVWDSTNSTWIKMNGNTSPFAPTYPTLQNGHVNWPGGFGADVLYGGNGRDHSWSWQMAVGYLKVATASGDATVTLKDSTRFPTTGKFILNNAGTLVTVTVTANNTTTGVLTISGTVGAVVPINSGVIVAMADDNGNIPVGNLFATWQQRLIIAGGYKTETLVNYSKLNTPEDFATLSGITGAGSGYFADGNGPITSLEDMGQFLLIGKRDVWIQFSFQYDSTLATKTVLSPPVVSGDSVGPLTPQSVVKAENAVYYPTAVNGLYQMAPVTTNTTTTVQTKLISEKINPTVTSVLSFQNCRTAQIDQKLLFAVAVPNSAQLTNPASVSTNNSIVLMYDLVWDGYVLFNNWNVQDFTTYQYNLYYLDNTNGNVYQTFIGQDDNGSVFLPYAIFKEHDFGQPALPKSQDLVYVAGLIDTGTQLKVDVRFNRGGSLGLQTFTINGNGNYVTSVPVLPLGGNAPLGSLPLGSGGPVANQNLVNSVSDNTGFFRVYLNCGFEFGFYTLQCKFYSQTQGAYWGILVVAHNPVMAPTYPVELVLSPG